MGIFVIILALINIAFAAHFISKFGNNVKGIIFAGIYVITILLTSDIIWLFSIHFWPFTLLK